MSQVIYVDVLFIINIYINYALLLITCYIRKYNANRLRLLLSAFFGGFYALIIIVPDLSDGFISLTRVPVLVIMTLLAFGYNSVRGFVRFLLSFLTVNFLFAGTMFALWYLFAPENMYFNNGVVYFDIDTLTLVLLTVAAYFFIKISAFFLKSRAPDNIIYNMKIFIGAEAFSCRALYDSGNSLSDPFTGEGVFIVNIDVLKSFVGEEIFENIENSPEDVKFKLIPASSVSGSSLLPCFRADRIYIEGLEKTADLKSPLIALCKGKIHGGQFGALMYASVFENSINERGESYVK